MRTLKGTVVQVIESHDIKAYFLESHIAEYLKSHPTCRLVVLEDIRQSKSRIIKLICWLVDGFKCTYRKRIITDRILKVGDITELTVIQLKVPTDYYVTFEDRIDLA